MIMLREFVATHQSGQNADAVCSLLAAIDDHVRAEVKRTRRAGRELFGERRRRFVRRIAKANRKDLEPQAPTPAPVTAAGTGPTSPPAGNGGRTSSSPSRAPS
jgi:hypothetical protein